MATVTDRFDSQIGNLARRYFKRRLIVIFVVAYKRAQILVYADNVGSFVLHINIIDICAGKHEYRTTAL